MGFEPEAGEGGFDLRAAIATIWRGRWIILVCMAVALAFSLLTVSQMRPVYTASAKMLFLGQRNNVANLEEVVLSNLSSRDMLQNEMEILRSSNLIGSVVDKLDLLSRPQFAPSGPSFSLRSLLDWRTYVSPRLLADLGIIDPPTPMPTDPAAIEARRRLGVIASVQASLRLMPIQNSRVLEISYTSGSPQLAAQIVNTVATQYIDSQLSSKIAATRQASDWLGDRIEELRKRVQDAELAVEAARAELASEAGQTSDVTRQQLSQMSGALASARADRARIEAQYDSASTALEDKATDFGSVSLFRDAPVIQRLRDQESDLVNRDATLATFARDNPNRARLLAQLDGIRDAIRTEAARIVAALRTDLTVIRERERTLEREIRALEETEEEQRRGEVELRQLERQAQASRTIYENFLARLEETSQQETLLAADAQVLSPAEVPRSPEATAKKRVVAMALILGAAAGVAIVLLLERLNNTFRGVKQVEDMLGLPVLAILPSIGPDADRRDVINQLRERPNGRLAEAVRNLRTSILFASTERAPRVVVFSSSVPSEGKSTSSLLLALTSQQMGRSAIIVDCDLRLHALSSLFKQTDQRPGLVSVIRGTASVEEAAYVDPDTGLKILTARSEERDETLNAADIVASGAFSDLIERLTSTHDLVILDTPPVLVVTDARVISRLADAVIYAVKWDATPRGAVVEGLRELRGIDAPLAGIVMTMVDADKVSTYAYEGYGYYRGRYNEYYG